jgi:hypothetical protein
MPRRTSSTPAARYQIDFLTTQTPHLQLKSYHPIGRVKDRWTSTPADGQSAGRRRFNVTNTPAAPLELELTFHCGRKHLPIIAIRRAA